MLICSAEIIHVGDACGAGTNLGASWRVIRGERSEIDVENRGDDGLAEELQKNFAAVSVLRMPPGTWILWPSSRVCSCSRKNSPRWSGASISCLRGSGKRSM